MIREIQNKALRTFFYAGLVMLMAITLAGGIGPALGEDKDKKPATVKLTPAQTDQVYVLQRYINSIKTMHAKFNQQTDDGHYTTGQFWLERPGKLRFEYTPPSGVKLIAKNGSLTYVDEDIQQVSEVGVDDTPASILLRSRLSFFSDVRLVGYKESQFGYELTILDKNEPDKGRLKLRFSRNPVRLTQWELKDPQGRIITITLQDMKTGIKIDPKRFEYQAEYDPLLQ